MFGDIGDSGMIVLENKVGCFRRNSSEHFTFECVDIGPVTKIRIKSDGKGVNLFLSNFVPKLISCLFSYSDWRRMVS